MIDEGYIKYRCEWTKADAVEPSSVVDLTRYRDALHKLNFIGEYPDGIGFGNLSQRSTPHSHSLLPTPHSPTPNLFTITGTQTGNLPTLTAADYARVTAFNPAQNSLTCEGLRKASSESLTHGVIYASHPAIGAIIHIHSPQLWMLLLGQVPTTRAEVPYGTPEMAAETQRLFEESDLARLKIFAMAGHEDGIVTFGETLQIAYRVLINWCLMTGFMSQSESAAALQLPH
ncbi:MAG: class II aldolase/adducin family protein [Cyanobacteria bacterium J06598_3]